MPLMREEDILIRVPSDDNKALRDFLDRLLIELDDRKERRNAFHRDAETEGSVLFMGPNGIAENNTGLYWDDANGRLGIGTDAPGAMLDVRGSAVFNENNEDADFQVEGVADPFLLLIDTSTDRVGIGTATPGSKLDVVGKVRASTQLESQQTTGTAPLVVASTTVVTNLNADLLDGNHASAFAAASHTHDHGADITGLTDDDHTQYALLAGRSGGQTLKGGTGSGDDLLLQSTDHATKGHIQAGTTESVVIGSAALATNATSGFLYVPSGAGAPSGTPEDFDGRQALYFDYSGNALYIYNSEAGTPAWKSIVLI